ncbi:MAG: hypothetical protein JWS12_946 [Candidatus Saccharibacteria bacterium]|nr:hypothetical protein [Candidatus Saccharibacteria bacterium]
MYTPYVSVVIPNWNGKDLLGACLDSLLAQTSKAEVVVVDNGSGDGSQSYLKKNYPEVTLIELDKNYGFSGGVNRGIEHAMKAGAKYVALFNNDAIADKHWLKNILAAAETQPKSGIVTSKFMRIDKKHLDSTGDFYSVWGLPFPRGRNELDNGQYDDKRDVFGASGGASLYRAAMLQEVGLFDETFFAYFEDVDMSFRAQLAGWKVVYAPQAIAYHHLSATTSKLGSFARYHSVKNFVLLYTKDMPAKLYWKYLPLACLQFIRLGLGSLVRGEFLTFMRGWLAALGLMGSTLVKRHHIQQSRKVSTAHIDGLLFHHRPPKLPALGDT